MIGPRDILIGIVLPMVFAAVCLVLVARPWGRGSRMHAALGWVLAVALGYGAAHLGLEGVPGEPLESQDWILLALLPGAVLIAILQVVPSVPRGIVWAARVLLGAGMPVVLLLSYLRQVGEPWAVWTAVDAMMWLGGLGAVCSVVWVCLARLERHDPGRSLPLGIGCAAGAAGLTVLMSASQSIGQLGLALAAALLGATLGSIGLKRSDAAAGSTAIAPLVLMAVVIVGHFYAELTAANALLLLLAPLGAWVGQVPQVRRRPTWQCGLVRVGAVAVPAVIAVVLAAITFRREISDPGYY